MFSGWHLIWVVGLLFYLLVYRPTANIFYQMGEAAAAAQHAQDAVRDYFHATGLPPMDRAEAGLPPAADYGGSPYVRSVDIVRGTVVVTFSDQAARPLAGKRIAMTPYEIDRRPHMALRSPYSPRLRRYAVRWRCGNAKIEQGAALLGTAAHGPVAMRLHSTVAPRHLPPTCKTWSDYRPVLLHQVPWWNSPI